MATKSKDKASILIYLSVFLITLSLFSYEILITRLFSVILSHNLVFLVVSFAILGSGLGGIYTYNIIKIKRDTEEYLIRSSIFLVISLIGTILIIYKMPYVPANSLYALIGMIPFIIGGSILSLLFKVYTANTSKLYFMDLIGSALGSLIIVWLLNTFGFMYSVIVVTAVLLLGSIFISIQFNRKTLVVIKAIILIIILGLLIQNKGIKEFEKGFYSYYSSPNTVISYLKGTREKPLGISYSKWDAIAKTDVIETTNKNEKIVVTDGGASAPIIRFDGDLKKLDRLKKAVNYLPFSFGDNTKTLVIGSGGGKDILFALAGGSNDISAVEINGATIEAVEKFKDFSGDIYNRPEVRTFNLDGRNFIEKTNERYDNIYLSMVMTNAIENTMFSLSENYLFTIEAFNKYFDSLESNGKLSIMTHSTLDMTRIVNTGIKVLMDRGVAKEDVTDYFIIANGASKDHMKGSNMIGMPMIIFKKVPFQDSEIATLKEVARSQNRNLVHYKGGEYKNYRVLKNRDVDFDQLMKAFYVNVKPIRDTSPFFYNYSKSLPKEILVIGAIAIALWWVIKRKYLKNKLTYQKSVYFAGIGLAFMLIEIPIIQKSILYFGSPTIAFSLVLFSILVSSGLGSLISGHSKVLGFTLKSPFYLLMAGISVIGVLLSIDNVIALTDQFSILYKAITILLMILPMGILIGIPFPMGMRMLRSDTVPLMWGVNGIFSVIGSIVGVGVSMKLGFNATMLLGGFIYMYLYLRNPLDIKL